jgi:hypothetical protein
VQVGRIAQQMKRRNLTRTTCGLVEPPGKTTDNDASMGDAFAKPHKIPIGFVCPQLEWQMGKRD